MSKSILKNGDIAERAKRPVIEKQSDINICNQREAELLKTICYRYGKGFA